MSIMKDAHSHISPLSYIAPFTPLHTQVSGNPSIFSTCTILCIDQKMPLESACSGVWMCIHDGPLQVPGYMLSQERRNWRDYSPPEQHPLPPAHHHGPQADIPFSQCHCLPPFSRPWSASQAENGQMSILYTK